MKHKHHIIPKHMGGTDDESNLVELTIEEHAEAHRKLYEEHGKLEDYLAWKGLSGQIGKSEILSEIYKQNGKNSGKKNLGKRAWNKGLTKEDPRVSRYTEKLKAPKTEEHKAAMKRQKSNSSNMGRYTRTIETKIKLSEAATKQYTLEARLAHSEIMKRRKTCQYCGMQSNASNVTRHEKTCKSRVPIDQIP
jgi:uncharacterized protein YeaO (DUF488 family)